MPDYGLRPPPYFSDKLPVGILGKAPYGWTQQENLSTANTPFNAYFPSENFVYERLDWQKFKQQLVTGLHATPQEAGGKYSNPPFLGAGQMTGPNGVPEWMRDQIGGVRRIVRGYLRRQTVDATSPESFVRLYYMYNPDQVQRQYLSWNEATTLDQGGQMGVDSDSAPSSVPSLTQISFTLYFDRQIEVATIEDHPGVMVDLQAFDVLSGNLVYTQTAANGDQSATVIPAGMSLPANTDATEDRSGQLRPTMSNTQTMVTAVFSPSLAVEGVLVGATASFTKFSQRMTPVTMALTITLLVSFVGKNNNQTSNPDVGAGTLTNPQVYNPQQGAVPGATQDERNYQTRIGAWAATQYALDNLLDTGTDGHYDPDKRDIGPPCTATHPFWTDCSSFVWRSFHAIGWTGTDQGDLLGLGGKCGSGAPDSSTFATNIRRMSSGTNRRWKIWQDMWDEDPPNSESSWDDGAAEFAALRRGDVLVRLPGYTKDSGHVAFFISIDGDLSGGNWNNKNIVRILDSGGKNMGSYKQGGQLRTTSMNDIWYNYNIWARPEPFGPTTDFSFGGVIH